MYHVSFFPFHENGAWFDPGDPADLAVRISRINREMNFPPLMIRDKVDH
jgi:hypothetical protein